MLPDINKELNLSNIKDNINCPDKTLDFCHQIIKIQIALKEKKYPEAIINAKILHSKYPKLTLSNTILGDLLLLDHQYQAAEDSYLNAKYIHDMDIAANLGMAELFKKKEDNESAIESLEIVIKKMPNHEKALWGLAKLYSDNAKKLEVLSVLYKLTPNNENLNLIYIRTLLINNKTKEARRIVAKAVKLFPNSLNINKAQGIVYLANAEVMNAVEVFDRLANLFPEIEDIWILWGLSVTQLMNIKIEEKALFIDIYKKRYLKKEDDAYNSATKLILNQNTRWFGHQVRGDILYNKKLLSKAKIEYEFSLYYKPTRLVLIKLSNILIEQNKVLESTLLLKNWPNYKFDDQIQVALIKNLIRSNQLSEAITLLKRIIKIDPSNIDIYSLLIRSYIAQANKTNVNIIINEALKIGSSDPLFQALVIIGESKITSDTDQLLNDFSRLSKKYPENNEILFFYAKFLLKNGQKLKAQELFKNLYIKAPLLLEYKFLQQLI